jgi:protein-L-isoaspartate O-methyltransferase
MAACLAQLAGPSGSVLALEKQPKLVQRALASIRAARDAGTTAAVDVRVCNGMAGEGQGLRVCDCQVGADGPTRLPAAAPCCLTPPDPPELSGGRLFDAIHVGGSLPAVPAAFVRLLKPGGRLVLPLGGMQGSAPQVSRAHARQVACAHTCAPTTKTSFHQRAHFVCAQNPAAVMATQVIATVDYAAADTAAGGPHVHQEHGSLPTRIAPLTRTQDDNVWSS